MADDPIIQVKTQLAGMSGVDDLKAIEALTGTGLAARTGTSTWATRTLTAGSGVSITNGDGVSGNPTISATGSGGTVTSVGLSLPSIITVSGSPVTTSGTLTGTLATQTANTVFSGPTTGVAATPTFRALVSADVPNLDAGKITTGTLGVARGGTGATSTPSNGQIPIGNGSTYTAATITAGSGITVTNGSGSITIASSAPASTDNSICQGRLTLGGSAVNTSSTASSTVVLYPYKGDRISLYSGGAWSTLTFTSSTTLSISGLSSSPCYDVWAYNNSGTVALDYTAWTNTSTRATSLTWQDGIYVKSGDATRRYLGTFYKSDATNTAINGSKNFVWNYYNRVDVDLYNEKLTGGTHSYSTATWREWNAETTNRIQFVIGVLEDAGSFQLWGGLRGSGTNRLGFGFNSTTAASNTTDGVILENQVMYTSQSVTGRRGTDIVLGLNYVTVLQYTDSGTGTFEKMSISGTIRG